MNFKIYVSCLSACKYITISNSLQYFLAKETLNLLFNSSISSESKTTINQFYKLF